MFYNEEIFNRTLMMLNENQKQSRLLERYKTKLTEVGTSRKGLTEALSQKDSEVETLRQQVVTLNESVQIQNKRYTTKIESLNTTITELKTDSEIKHKQYSQKLQKCNKMVESYRTVAKNAIDRYIECKATNLGITATEIKNRLRENYSFDDIDKVCESLRSYKRNISKLPFDINNVSRVTLKEDATTQRFTNPDDVVDQNLFDLLNN